MRANRIAKAFNVLRDAIQHDPSYAHVWHCNIAMSCYDAGANREVANEAANRCMTLLFGATGFLSYSEHDHLHQAIDDLQQTRQDLRELCETVLDWDTDFDVNLARDFLLKYGWRQP